MCAEPRPLIVAVEDEPELLNIITEQLEVAGMHVQAYNRCAPALRFLQHNFANLLLLDLTLPDLNGFEMLKELKQQDINVPVIFLTGNSMESDKIKGLNMGGDDYITNPFIFFKFVPRINPVLRRPNSKRAFNATKNVK